MNAFQRGLQSILKVFGFSGRKPRHRPYRPEDHPDGDQNLAHAWSYYDNRMTLAQTRVEVYKEMEELDEDDITHEALTAFAEDATQPEPFTGRTVWVESQNLEVQQVLHQLFDAIELEDNIFTMTRSTCKSGDAFYQLITSEGDGVVGMEWMRPQQVERIQDVTGLLTGWHVYDSDIPATLEQPSMNAPETLGEHQLLPWDVVHFRLQGTRPNTDRTSLNTRGIVYGEPLLLAARRPFRRFRMAEDEMNLYRLLRAPDRDKFKIDTTGLNPGERWDYARTWYRQYKKRQFLDQQMQSADNWQKYGYHPRAVDADIYLATSEGSLTDIERQAGSANVGDIHDIDFLLRRVFSCIRLPKEYFGFDSEGWDQTKALAQKDIRTARTCKRIQRAVIIAITRVCQIHLSWRGMDPTLPQNDFIVKMTPMSLLEEQDRSELYNLRADLIDRLMELGEKVGLEKKPWAYFVIRTFGGFPETIAKEFLKNIKPEEAGGGGGGLGGGDLGLGDLGGGEGGLDLGGGGGGLDLGGAEEGGGGLDLGGEEAAAGGEEEGGVALESALRAFLRSDPKLRRLVEGLRLLKSRQHRDVIRSSERLAQHPLPLHGKNSITETRAAAARVLDEDDDDDEEREIADRIDAPEGDE